MTHHQEEKKKSVNRNHDGMTYILKFENRNLRYAIVTISKSRKRKYCHNEYADGRSQQKNIKYKKNQMKILEHKVQI